jgi:bifunctional DNA-binding transcriptional regulator/antitoxin component of YhaV-PrlF toxin-antitoxin module
MPDRVKQIRRRGYTRVSPKHQVTLTVDALTAAGLRAGDELRIEVIGPGSVQLTRTEDVLERYAGSMPDVFPPDAIQELRTEWD